MHRIFNDLAEAQQYHAELGGWLLQTAHLSVNPHMKHGDEFTVTDDVGLVKDLRGEGFIEQCEKAECWDETLSEEENV